MVGSILKFFRERNSSNMSTHTQWIYLRINRKKNHLKEMLLT